MATVGASGPLGDQWSAGIKAARGNQELPALYTTEEAAAVLRVKRSWLERQAAQRKIPFTMLGGAYRFTSAHLAEIVLLYEESPAVRNNTPGRGRTASAHASGLETAPLRPRPRLGPRRAGGFSAPGPQNSRSS
jgi:excisionase family DNA binding protein